MADLYTTLWRPLLFRLDAETAHRLTFRVAGALAPLVPGPPARQVEQPTEVFGLRFRNPIGLAAGMDKNAELLPVWRQLGFGFVEVGTVTPRPQPGNPRPRLFRLAADRALLNRMGFNNDGAARVAQRLARRPAGLVVGINVGKNASTPLHEAYIDYRLAFDRLQDVADYAVLNVSSPNTPGLRELQGKDSLLRILDAVQNLNQARRTPLPLLLKLAPELGPDALADVVSVAQTMALSGFVATNTWGATPEGLAAVGPTLATPPAELAALAPGGLSGPFLLQNDLSLSAVRQLAASGLPVIGVGGVSDAGGVARMRQAGAHLVQVYTALVYRGPALLRELLAASA